VRELLKNSLYKKRWRYGVPLSFLAIVLGKWLPLYIYIVIALSLESKWLLAASLDRNKHE